MFFSCDASKLFTTWILKSFVSPGDSRSNSEVRRTQWRQVNWILVTLSCNSQCFCFRCLHCIFTAHSICHTEMTFAFAWQKVIFVYLWKESARSVMEVCRIAVLQCILDILVASLNDIISSAVLLGTAMSKLIPMNRWSNNAKPTCTLSCNQIPILGCHTPFFFCKNRCR
jgi:hypothetical protein